jgi:hypothetical protein
LENRDISLVLDSRPFLSLVADLREVNALFVIKLMPLMVFSCRHKLLEATKQKKSLKEKESPLLSMRKLFPVSTFILCRQDLTSLLPLSDEEHLEIHLHPLHRVFKLSGIPSFSRPVEIVRNPRLKRYFFRRDRK